MSNPYNYGTVVTDPRMFFGRGSILNDLCARLRNMQSTSIVGLRRIGKSSLLYQLARILPDALGPGYVPLYIDLQDAQYRTVADFVEAVTVALGERLGESLAVSDVTDMSSFSRMVRRLSHDGIKPILCLDEFEEFMQHSEEFNDDFLEALRALGGHAKLAMVTASRTPLVDLIRAGQLTSPFHNIFSQIELGLLESGASRALRCEPFEQEGIVLSPEHEVLVEELGGRHPFFLQMACYYLYEALRQFQRTRVDVIDLVRERFNRDAEPHFERLWHNLSAGEKAALRVPVGKAVSTNETERLLKRLGYLGVVEQVNGSWQPFSATFAECVQRYSILGEVVPRALSAETAKMDAREPGIAVPKAAVLIIGFLILLTLILLTIGALTNSVMFILFSAVSAGVLLFLIFWYRR